MNDILNHHSNCNLYSIPWFLDIMTEQKWSVLVLGDYEMMMPIYNKRKFFIPYITQAFLCQQISVLSKENIGSEEIAYFENYIRKHFFKANISISSPIFLNKSYTTKINHVLNLEKSYPEIYQNYNRNTKRNINLAKTKNLKFSETIDDIEFLQFMVEHDKTQLIKMHRNKVLELLKYTKQEKKSYTIIGKDDLGINSIAYFIIENDVLYFLLCASNERGIKQSAMFLLIDLAIQKFAGKVRSMDFTGSSIKSIARRNEGFGALPIEYYHYSFSKW